MDSNLTPTTAEDKRKHLEFVQLVITRMNVNSFLLKGWTVTLVAALFALAARDANAYYVIFAFVSIPVFWSLDAYYLSLERQYRDLYNRVRLIPENNIDYNLAVHTESKGNSWWSCLWRPAIVYFHLIFLLATIFVTLILAVNENSTYCNVR